MELVLKIGDTTSSLPEVVNVLKWIFLIVCVVAFVIIYIKKKNADSGENKHS